MKWKITSHSQSRCLNTVIPESYRVRQVDVLTSEQNAVKNVSTYGSYDGIHWKLYPKESYTYVGDTMFSVISPDPLLPYFRIRFDEYVTAGDVNYAVRVYGEDSCGITGLSMRLMEIRPPDGAATSCKKPGWKSGFAWKKNGS